VALESFEGERRLLDAALLDRVPHSMRGRVGELALDISDGLNYALLPAIDALLIEQDRVSRVLERQLAPYFSSPRQLSELASGESDEPFTAAGSHERLRLAFKLLYITFRSMQDALNTSCSWLVHGAWPNPRKASMQYALNRPESDVGALIATRLPGYGQWFADWRRQRNRVKDGTGFGSFALEGDVGIQFTTLTDENALVVDLSVSRVGLADIAEALSQTCALMQLVRELAAE
jgi:hypothetical protein